MNSDEAWLEYSIAERIQDMANRYAEIVSRRTEDDAPLIAVFSGGVPAARGRGWWAIWGYLDHADGRVEFYQKRAWRLTRWGAERTCRRRAQALRDVRSAVKLAEKRGS